VAVVVGFIAGLNPLLVVIIAGLLSGLLAHLSLADILDQLGSGFLATRNLPLIFLLTVICTNSMALTSWTGAIRRLGARRWQNLHRSIYAVAVLAILHFWWMRAGKNNFNEVWVYALILAALLGWRLIRRLKDHRA
jgi:DMSO/TMAO reductase YedYZ heme-binding membrane subunit